ncbi:MAG: SLC13/DASS family transporter [Gemmatimonadetes bacterium]|nr:SLC13/DASS family transporter [Gemmatimonadota bacterium]
MMAFVPPPAGASSPAWRTAAVGILMATWWVTEAIPIPATALLPLLLFPLLGISRIADAAAPYANPVIFLFLGGFLIAAALQRCGLHIRAALAIILVVGTRPSRMIAGFMTATALISLWVSNTATVVMLLPLAASVIELAERERPADVAPDPHFPVALLLGLAYAASIGGLGTLIGTPPNALLAGFMSETYGRQIGFVQWMVVGVPLVVVALPITWFLLTHVLYPVRPTAFAAGREVIARELRLRGPLSRTELMVGAITALTAAAWIGQPLLARMIPGLSDTGIAMAAALLLFGLPTERRTWKAALDWTAAAELPWGVLLLFGGGLSLAAAIQDSGLAGWIGSSLEGLRAFPVLVMVAAVTTLVIFLTELTSNTAIAATFLPVAGSLAVGIGADPMLFAVPTALAASCAFMMPVATPPNALVYGTGRVTILQMARAGLILNFVMVVLIVAAVYWLARPVLGAGG